MNKVWRCPLCGADHIHLEQLLQAGAPSLNGHKLTREDRDKILKMLEIMLSDDKNEEDAH